MARNNTKQELHRIKHESEDAEAAYVDAVYRFRKAEALGSADYSAARSEMNRLEAKVRSLKYGY